MQSGSCRTNEWSSEAEGGTRGSTITQTHHGGGHLWASRPFVVGILFVPYIPLNRVVPLHRAYGRSVQFRMVKLELATPPPPPPPPLPY